MNKLNAFNVKSCPWTYPSNWVSNIRLFGRKFKWAYQRVTRGFSDWDTWDLDQYFLKLIPAALRHLAKHTHGYPGTERFPTFESWQKYLLDMAELFERAENEEGKYYPNPAEDAWGEVIAKWDNLWENHTFKDPCPELSQKMYEIEKANQDRVDMDMRKAFEMLVEVFWSLWD